VSVGFEICTDKSKIDIDAVCRYLQQESYWANSRSRGDILKSIEHSKCYAMSRSGILVGFARVVTDYVTIAYLADVFVIKDFQGQGYGRHLLDSICSDAELEGLRMILLTKDAHGFYEKHGFTQDDWLKGLIMQRKAL
jgi:GNAT superfamily N-acetyltransferase